MISDADGDLPYMLHALRLAERGLGNTYPNPSVGAVIVNDGTIIGRGWTARGGRPHAETIALAEAGGTAKNATLYVTLEPCVHHGKTPPCVDAILQASISRVVVGCTDPNPLMAGKGLNRLRTQGVIVTEGVCEAQAMALNAGFFSVIHRKRPLVTLKLATSRDYKITSGDITTRWLTNEASRRIVHHMRASYDAILTGIGTVETDNPRLTCRLPGREQDSPLRVVVDTRLRIAPDAAVLPAWIFTSHATWKQEHEKIQLLTQAGSRIFAVPDMGKGLMLTEILTQLAAEGVTRVMVEAGRSLSLAFIEEQLANTAYWFRAPMVIGEKGLGLTNDTPPSFSLPPAYHLQEHRPIGDDVLEVYALNL